MLNLQKNDEEKIGLNYNGCLSVKNFNVFKIEGRRFLFCAEQSEKQNVKKELVKVFCSRILENSKNCSFLVYDLAKFDDKVGSFSPFILDDKTLYFFTLEDLELISQENSIVNCKIDLEQFKVNENFGAFYSVNEKFEKEHNLKTFQLTSVDEILDFLKNFCEKFDFALNLKSVRLQLSEIVICDYFLCNDDRTFNDIVFLVKNNNGRKELIVAPSFGFGNSFRIINYQKYLEIIKNKKWENFPILEKIENKFSCNNSILEKTGKLFNLTKNAPNLNFEQKKKFNESVCNLSVKGYIVSKFENGIFLNYCSTAIDILNLARKDEKLEKLVNYFLNLDIIKALIYFEIEEKVTIEQPLKDFIEEEFLYKREIYKKLQKWLKTCEKE